MPDVVREAWITEGRDPDWRVAWEEYLSSEARQEVEDAVKAGRTVTDDDLRMYAVGLARKSMRQSRWMVLLVPLNLALVGVWIYFACVRHALGSLPCWFWATVGVLCVTALPLRLVTRYRRFAEAERANSKLHWLHPRP
jgi:positive regulator of sigma E activity